MKGIKLVLLILGIGWAGFISQAQQLAFPTAEGFGKNTTGGRGGKLYIVSNLNDAGSGSLREALDASGKRIVVFSVSGIIKLQSDINIKNGDLSIFGQTAPGDGICIANYTVQLSASNIIIRYMRFRPGSYQGGEYDASWGRNNSNIILDHCSYSWGNDEQASFYDNTNFTMQYCIISESFYSSTHPKGNHGFGGIWGGMGATFHHNLIVNHTSRTPRFCGARYHLTTASTEKVDFRNNVIFNWGYNNVYGGESGNHNIVNNYYKPGPATSSGKVQYRIVNPSDAKSSGNPISKWYISGNYVQGNAAVTADNWNGGVQQDDASITLAELKLTSPLTVVGINTQSAQDAYTKVLASAGASLKRDAVDSRAVNSTTTGVANYGGVFGANKGIIDNENQVGGYPTYASVAAPADSDKDGMPDSWESDHGLNVSVADQNGDRDGDGYTNIEEYANCLAGEGTTCSVVKKPLRYVYIYDNSGNFSWTNTNSWTPKAVPTAIDTVIIRTGEVQINGLDHTAPVMVEPNGILRLVSANSTVKDLRLQGGTLKLYTSSPEFALTSNIKVEAPSTVMAGSVSATIFTLNGTISGNYDLTKTSAGNLRINSAAAGYKGNWIISEGKLQLRSASGLGVCGVQVKGGARLDVEAAGATIYSLKIDTTGGVDLDNSLAINVAVFGKENLASGNYTNSLRAAYIGGTGTLSVSSSLLSYSGKTVVCPGTTLALQSSSGTSYVWKNGATQVGTNSSYTVTGAGTYTVTPTSFSGCKVTSAGVTITTDPCSVSGVNEEQEMKDVKMYPNPFADRAVVHYPGKFMYQLFDSRGVLLKEGESMDKVEVGADLPKGLYLLKLNTGSANRTLSLIKE